MYAVIDCIGQGPLEEQNWQNEKIHVNIIYPMYVGFIRVTDRLWSSLIQQWLFPHRKPKHSIVVQSTRLDASAGRSRLCTAEGTHQQQDT